MVRALIVVLCAVPVVAGVTALYYHGRTDADIKSVLDSLAPDGEAIQYDLARVAEIRERLVPAGIAWIALGLVGFGIFWVYRRQLAIGSSEILSQPLRLMRRLGRLRGLDRFHLVLVLLLTGVMAVLAISGIDQSMRCDEAGMFRRYASQPWYFIAANYDTPNNHILHTLLVHGAVKLLGEEPWIIRLPALFAGILLVPVGYWFCRSQFGRGASILFTAILATSAYTIDQATNSRGYAMLSLVFLSILALVPRLIRQNRWIWIAVVALMVTGFWLVPIMVFPAAIIGFWLLFFAIRCVDRRDRLPFITKIAVTYLAAGVIAIGLYSPAHVMGSVTDMAERQMEFGRVGGLLDQIRDLGWRGEELWRFWRHGWPPGLGWLLAFGVVLGVPFSRRVSRGSNLLLLATVAGVLSVLFVTRANPPFWVLGFLFPLFVALGAVGLAGGISEAGRRLRRRLPTDGILTVAALALALVSGVRLVQGKYLENVPWLVGYWDAKEAAGILAEPVRRGAKVSSGGATPSSLVFYFHRRGLDDGDPFSWKKGRLPRRVYLIDTGKPDVERETADLLRNGYRQTRVVAGLSHSRILLYERERGDARSAD